MVFDFDLFSCVISKFMFCHQILRFYKIPYHVSGSGFRLCVFPIKCAKNEHFLDFREIHRIVIMWW